MFEAVPGGTRLALPAGMITMDAMPLSLHVRRMLALIEERSAEPLSLATFARALNRQAGYLGRLFREEIGVGMREYLARLRLERAARMIREGVKVEAVALEVGYRSKKNFYRQFRRRFGTTPALYRAAAGEPSGT
ncbi:MAG: helix-turn-helix domain-containing protein [Vicinamibacterales bacterium]